MYTDALSPGFFGNLAQDEYYDLILPARFLVTPEGHHALRSMPESMVFPDGGGSTASGKSRPAKDEHIRGWMGWQDCAGLNPLLQLAARYYIPCQLDKDWHYFQPSVDVKGVVRRRAPAFAIAVGLGPNAVTHRILSFFCKPAITIRYTCAATRGADVNKTLHDEIRFDDKPCASRHRQPAYDEKTEEKCHHAIIARCPTLSGGRLFVCAGETAHGTQVACSYFAQRWANLAREMLAVDADADVWNRAGQYWVFRYRESSSKLTDEDLVLSNLDCDLYPIESNWTEKPLEIQSLELRKN